MALKLNPITGELDYYEAAVAGHDAATVSDTTSLNLSITGQEISGAVNFGTGAGVAAEGNHAHAGVYEPADATIVKTGNANVFTAAQKINVNSTTALFVEQDGVKDNVFLVDTTNARVGVNEGTLSYGFNVGGLGLVARIGNTSASSVTGSVFSIGDVGSGSTKANAFIGSYYNAGPVLYVSSNIYWNNSSWTAPDATKKTAKIAMEGGNIYFSTGPNGTNPSGRWTVHNSGGVAIGDTFRNTDPGVNNIIIEGVHGVGVSAPLVKEHIRESTTTTNAIKEVLRIEAAVSTAATGGANGFGASQTFYAETATDATYQQQGLISASWIDATNATRKAKLSLSAYDTAARLGLEIEASGTVAKLGFFGGTTAIQQVLNAYTSDAEGGAYTGIDNAQAGTVYATVADLNTLRTAYETLRASYDDLRTKLQTSTLVA